MPAEAAAIVGSNYWKWNGQWQWTDSEPSGHVERAETRVCSRGPESRSASTTRRRFAPATPGTRSRPNSISAASPGFETVSFLEPPYFGVTSYQNTAPLLQGVPQQTFSNPFPGVESAAADPRQRRGNERRTRPERRPALVQAGLPEGVQRSHQRIGCSTSFRARLW